MIKITVHASGGGQCSLSGRDEADGLHVAFENDQPCFLSRKAFWQLLSMRLRQNEPKAPPKIPTAQPTLPLVAK